MDVQGHEFRVQVRPGMTRAWWWRVLAGGELIGTGLRPSKRDAEVAGATCAANAVMSGVLDSLDDGWEDVEWTG